MDACRLSFSRRGWAVLLWGVGLFTMIQAGLGLFLHGRPSYRDQVLGYKLELLERQMAAHPGRPLVLFLGSSRVRCGVRPDVLAGCGTDASRQPLVFNYGENGTGPLYNLVCLNRLLARGIVPRYLFIEVWSCHLTEASQQQDLERMSGEPLEWCDLPLLRRYAGAPENAAGRWLLEELLPVYTCRLLVQHHLPGRLGTAGSPTPYPRDVDALGWHAASPVADAGEKVRKLAYWRPRIEPGFQRWRVAPALDDALRAILSLCREHGIQAGLVYLPEGSDVRSWYPPAVAAALDDYLRRLSRDCGVPCIDARGWAPDRQLIDDLHLDRAGALAFTERFGREVLQPLLQRDDP